ncbi:SagB-type dehydrogenase domain-containing protein [Halogranum amylolyticum]|uniref:SagB-type dehydrogenase domain-containing protein n=1 Tax=Halogranum amylolyticum TaxID=660520 RepID=A0A1H8MVA0_9EURY|nr:SagB family peptide dehydrogenase [Halogranum amylolyticum]SEO21156.1 SagB-type dehydrogenase domain-containing protein [Halogranum amylolyticum]
MVDAREYHERTKHSPASIRNDSFSLDFENQPRPYKVYEDLPRVTPTESPRPPRAAALSAIATATSEPESAAEEETAEIDARTLHALCHYATGVTKEIERQGRRMRFRAASCTGKLYHVDLYAVTGDLDGLDAGVYHFDPDTEAFDVLREGDYRGVLAEATDSRDVATAPVTFVATSEWWRNAWKYRERTYRHAFWDSGTILANLLAVAHGGGHRAAVVTGFADDPVADLLGVDPETEAPLELVPVGSGDPVPDPRTVDPIDPTERPLSETVVDYPLVPDAWRQSRLTDASEGEAWRDRVAETAESGVVTHGMGDGETVSLDPVDAETASGRPVGATVERRGSLREYSHDAISARLFATVMDRTLRGVPIDCVTGGTGRLLDYYCLVHAVEGIPSGAYQYHPEENALERLGETSRQTAGHLALDQSVVGDAAVNVYLMADVDGLVERVGNRGYRLAQLLGGVGLGRLYLATYAHRRLGGRGFTFYDDLVTEHLSPRAENQTPTTLFAFGKPT